MPRPSSKQNNHRSKRAVTESNRYGCESYRCGFNDKRPKIFIITAITTLCTALNFVNVQK